MIRIFCHVLNRYDDRGTGFERRVHCSQFSRGRGTPCHTGPHGKHQGWSGGRRSEGKVQAKAFIVVFKRSGQGRVSNWAGLGSESCQQALVYKSGL